ISLDCSHSLSVCRRCRKPFSNPGFTGSQGRIGFGGAGFGLLAAGLNQFQAFVQALKVIAPTGFAIRSGLSSRRLGGLFALRRGDDGWLQGLLDAVERLSPGCGKKGGLRRRGRHEKNPRARFLYNDSYKQWAWYLHAGFEAGIRPRILGASNPLTPTPLPRRR